MAFEKFKAAHGGLGPFQALYSGLTEGEGLLGQWRPKVVRDRWDATFDAIRDDPALDGDFKTAAAGVRRGNYTAPQMLDIIGKVQARAQDLRTINGGVGTVTDELDRLDAQSVSPGDKQQITALRSRAELARRFAVSGNPDLEKQGQADLLKLTADLQGFAATNDAQAIAAEQARTTQGIEGEKLRFDRDMALSTDLRKNVVTPYQTQEALFAKAKQLLDTGDRLGYDFAFTMAIQSLDGSVVRSDERLAYTGSNGFAAQAVDLYNKWQGQKTPEVEAALRRAIGALHNANAETYRTTVDTYRKQTGAYGGDWSRVGSVVPELQDWSEPGKPKETTVPEPKADPLGVAAAAAVTAADKIPDSVKTGAAAAAGVAGPAALARFAPSALAAAPYLAPAAVYGALAASNPNPGFAPEELKPDGTIRGVYVPRFLRKHFMRHTDEYPQP